MFIQADTDHDPNRKAGPKRRRRSLLRDESGQSIIIVALALFAVVGFTALAIDVATWYQRHHQAQVAADAAALAAANCLVYAGTTGQTCTSTTDTTDAIAVATNYAKSNGVTIPASDVSFDNATYPSVITVTTPDTSPALFAGIFGIGTTTQTAKSSATWKDTGKNCATAGIGCQLIFANDNSCSGGITIATNGTGNSAQINGGVQSNGSITLAKSTGNPTYNSVATYPAGCSGPSTTSAVAPWANPGVNDTVPKNWPNDWPVDYRDFYPPCTMPPAQGVYSPLFGYVNCNPTTGVPSYCDQSGWSFNLSSTDTQNEIYCAYGFGPNVKKDDPSTWNGTISVTGAFMSTLIGGSVSVTNSGTGTSGPKPGNNLWIYATQPAAPGGGPALNVNISGSGLTSGSMFAPFGTLLVTMGGTPGGAGVFLEGLDVNFTSNGTPSASGPADTSAGYPATALGDGLVN